MIGEKGADAVCHHLPGILARHRQRTLADEPRRTARLVEHRAERLFDIVGLTFLDDQHRLLAFTEGQELVIDQRIRHIEDVERNLRLAVDIGQSEALEAAHDGIVHAALKHDTDIGLLRPEHLVEPVPADVVERSGQPLVDLLMFMQERGGRQHDARRVAARIVQRIGHCHLR